VDKFIHNLAMAKIEIFQPHFVFRF